MTLLDGQPIDPKPAKPKKPESDGRVVRLEAGFRARYAVRWGGLAYKTRQIGRDRRLLKEWAAELTDDELFELMDVFFATGDREVDRCQYTIPDFCRLIPRLRLLGQRQSVGDRTAANLAAAARATGRQR